MRDIWWVVLVTLVAFGLGSLPFAVWLCQLLGRCDVREAGDGNPGTANAFKAAGWRTGVPVLLLELGKAGVPVGLANWVLGIGSWGMVPIALAPVVGHAFSPFLRFRGGKAIAATFGAWAGLTGWMGPAALALSMGVVYGVQKADAWAVAGGMTLFGTFLLLVGSPLALMLVWGVNMGILCWRHQGGFAGTLGLREWVPAFKHRGV